MTIALELTVKELNELITDFDTHIIQPSKKFKAKWSQFQFKDTENRLVIPLAAKSMKLEQTIQLINGICICGVVARRDGGIEGEAKAQ